MAYKVSVPTGIGIRIRFYDTQLAAMRYVGEQVRKHSRLVIVNYRDGRPFFFGGMAPTALTL